MSTCSSLCDIVGAKTTTMMATGEGENNITPNRLDSDDDDDQDDDAQVVARMFSNSPLDGRDMPVVMVKMEEMFQRLGIAIPKIRIVERKTCFLLMRSKEDKVKLLEAKQSLLGDRNVQFLETRLYSEYPQIWRRSSPKAIRNALRICFPHLDNPCMLSIKKTYVLSMIEKIANQTESRKLHSQRPAFDVRVIPSAMPFILDDVIIHFEHDAATGKIYAGQNFRFGPKRHTKRKFVFIPLEQCSWISPTVKRIVSMFLGQLAPSGNQDGKIDLYDPEMDQGLVYALKFDSASSNDVIMTVVLPFPVGEEFSEINEVQRKTTRLTLKNMLEANGDPDGLEEFGENSIKKPVGRWSLKDFRDDSDVLRTFQYDVAIKQIETFRSSSENFIEKMMELVGELGAVYLTWYHASRRCRDSGWKRSADIYWKLRCKKKVFETVGLITTIEKLPNATQAYPKIPNLKAVAQCIIEMANITSNSIVTSICEFWGINLMLAQACRHIVVFNCVDAVGKNCLKAHCDPSKITFSNTKTSILAEAYSNRGAQPQSIILWETSNIRGIVPMGFQRLVYVANNVTSTGPEKKIANAHDFCRNLTHLMSSVIPQYVLTRVEIIDWSKLLRQSCVILLFEKAPPHGPLLPTPPARESIAPPTIGIPSLLGNMPSTRESIAPPTKAIPSLLGNMPSTRDSIAPPTKAIPSLLGDMPSTRESIQPTKVLPSLLENMPSTRDSIAPPLKVIPSLLTTIPSFRKPRARERRRRGRGTIAEPLVNSSNAVERGSLSINQHQNLRGGRGEKRESTSGQTADFGSAAQPPCKVPRGAGSMSDSVRPDDGRPFQNRYGSKPAHYDNSGPQGNDGSNGGKIGPRGYPPLRDDIHQKDGPDGNDFRLDEYSVSRNNGPRKDHNPEGKGSRPQGCNQSRDNSYQRTGVREGRDTGLRSYPQSRDNDPPRDYGIKERDSLLQGHPPSRDVGYRRDTNREGRDFGPSGYPQSRGGGPSRDYDPKERDSGPQGYHSSRDDSYQRDGIREGWNVGPRGCPQSKDDGPPRDYGIKGRDSRFQGYPQSRDDGYQRDGIREGRNVGPSSYPQSRDGGPSTDYDPKEREFRPHGYPPSTDDGIRQGRDDGPSSYPWSRDGGPPRDYDPEERDSRPQGCNQSRDDSYQRTGVREGRDTGLRSYPQSRDNDPPRDYGIKERDSLLQGYPPSRDDGYKRYGKRKGRDVGSRSYPRSRDGGPSTDYDPEERDFHPHGYPPSRDVGYRRDTIREGRNVGPRAYPPSTDDGPRNDYNPSTRDYYSLENADSRSRDCNSSVGSSLTRYDYRRDSDIPSTRELLEQIRELKESQKYLTDMLSAVAKPVLGQFLRSAEIAPERRDEVHSSPFPPQPPSPPIISALPRSPTVNRNHDDPELHFRIHSEDAPTEITAEDWWKWKKRRTDH